MKQLLIPLLLIGSFLSCSKDSSVQKPEILVTISGQPFLAITMYPLSPSGMYYWRTSVTINKSLPRDVYLSYEFTDKMNYHSVTRHILPAGSINCQAWTMIECDKDSKMENIHLNSVTGEDSLTFKLVHL